MASAAPLHGRHVGKALVCAPPDNRRSSTSSLRVWSLARREKIDKLGDHALTRSRLQDNRLELLVQWFQLYGRVLPYRSQTRQRSSDYASA